MENQLSKKRKVSGWVIAGLITALLLFSAMGKFMMPEMAENFTKWGLGDWRIILLLEKLYLHYFSYSQKRIFLAHSY